MLFVKDCVSGSFWGLSLYIKVQGPNYHIPVNILNFKEIKEIRPGLEVGSRSKERRVESHFIVSLTR